MIRKSGLLLALSAAVAGTPGSGPTDPLETIHSGAYAHPSGFHATASLLNWNIDRGKHEDGVLAAIRENHADLCIFQEVDLGARRTQGRDVAHDLAAELGMDYAFAPEFRELSQGTGDGDAYHGQAILSRMPIRSTRILRFTRQSGFWKPKPLLISSLPLFQRREGGRIAQISELDNGGHILAVYNLHLESRGDEQLRLAQLEEVLADAAQYGAATPLIIAGDFNTKSRHSPLIPRLRQAGYRSAFGDRRIRTHVILGALDWVFVRGPVEFEDAAVQRGSHASDHDPIAVKLKFTK